MYVLRAYIQNKICECARFKQILLFVINIELRNDFKFFKSTHFSMLGLYICFTIAAVKYLKLFFLKK